MKTNQKFAKKLVLIDGHALVHRAFHALPLLTAPNGVPTNAIFGFMSLFLKMIKELHPDYIAAAFDLPGGTFRHEEFAEYKSHRVKAPDELHAQVPYIKDLLRAFGVPIFEKPGFEADDVIGALALAGSKQDDLQTVIVTGDLDTLQLVRGNQVVVFTMRKGLTDTIIYDEKAVDERYGLEPSQLIDFKGLKGDPSDNIPGVPGVGDKTASALIQKFGNLEKLYQIVEKKGAKPKLLTPKLIERLTVNKEQAFFSKKLSTIICDIEIDFSLDGAAWRANMDRPKLEALLKDLALYSLVKRLSETDEPVAPPQSLFDDATVSPVAVMPSQVLAEWGDVEVFLKKAIQEKELIVDLSQEVLSLSYAEGVDCVFSVSLLADAALAELFKKIIEDATIRKTTADGKPLAKWLLRQEMHLAGLEFDLKLAAYILNSDIRDYDLDKLYFGEFGQDMVPDARLAAIRKLADHYTKLLAKTDSGRVLQDIEVPLVTILTGMEAQGILVDRAVVNELGKKVSAQLAELERDIYTAAGGEFNINSPKQLSEILFEKLNLKGKVKKTASGGRLSTAAGELDKLIDEHPVVALIIKHRELQKLKTTYIEPLPLLIDAKDKRLHTTYNQAGATTGRLSSTDPNLQNIPIRTELGQEFRKAFVAAPGKQLLSCDYSQLELRIAASLSGDPAMTEAFRQGEDIHTRTAARVFRVEPSQVTSGMRRQAKVLNFGILYGMGILGFQRGADVSREEARQFIANYHQEFSSLMQYMETVKQKARDDGYVSTIFGRRRQIPDIHSTMPAVVAGAERTAINMPIQGTGADLIKLAMIQVQALIEKKYSGRAWMLLQVHDELLFEIDTDIVQEVALQIVAIMENVHKFNVPIVVDAKVGDNWAEMEEI